MAQITVEESKLKGVVLDVLNDLFNFGDIEEAKRTPVGRLISLEAKVESLATEIQLLEKSLRSEIGAVRSEMASLDKRLTERMNSLEKRLTEQGRLLYIILVALVGGLIKLIFFP